MATISSRTAEIDSRADLLRLTSWSFRDSDYPRQKSEPSGMTALPLIVFDVNETLLELQIMEPVFERIFGEKTAMRLWFANFIRPCAFGSLTSLCIPRP